MYAPNAFVGRQEVQALDSDRAIEERKIRRRRFPMMKSFGGLNGRVPLLHFVAAHRSLDVKLFHCNCMNQSAEHESMRSDLSVSYHEQV